MTAQEVGHKPETSTNVLSVRNLSVHFGGLKAVNDVNFELKRGEILSVIGPNGAGKTTVFNVVTGVYQPTDGQVFVTGRKTERELSLKVFLVFAAIGIFSALFLFGLVNVETLWKAAISDVYVYRQPFSWQKSFESLLAAIRGVPHSYSLFWCAIGFLIGALGSYSVWSSGRRSPEVVSWAGVSRTFQNIRLFPELSVLENILVGMDAVGDANLCSCALRLPNYRKESRACLRIARELLELVDLGARECERAGSLPYGMQRRLEIARALARSPKLLLLDEPAAGMNPTESQELMELIQRIREKNVSIVLIEHHMDVVMGISDRIVVLDYGNKIAEGTPDEIRTNPKVIEAYLGKESDA